MVGDGIYAPGREGGHGVKMCQTWLPINECAWSAAMQRLQFNVFLFTLSDILNYILSCSQITRYVVFKSDLELEHNTSVRM